MRTIGMTALVGGVIGAMTVATAGSTGRCGGTGGSNEIALSCPAGQYIIGIGARGGAFVDSISIRCAPFDGDGNRGRRSDWKTGGAEGGTRARDGQCPSTDAVNEIFVASAIYLDKVQVARCTKRKRNGGFSGFTEAFVVDTGGWGGAPCQLKCPTGEALHEIIVKYGGWVDSIKGKCRS